jgi:segregation and condensation protein A
MPYAVDTPVFQGPFDLLLHLILREQVDLYEITLSEIVDAYLRELEKMDSLDLEVATEFLMIAATLVELKTKRLLPAESDLDLDEELALWEERDLLLSRLLECKTFKDAARVLQRLSAAAARSFPRTAGLDEQFLGLAPDPLEGLSGNDLRRAFLKAITPKPIPTVDIAHIHQLKVTVADAVEELVYELPRAGRTTFRALTASFADRIQVVVRFLAILELYKQGMVDLDQPGAFGDIEIVWLGGELARADLGLVDAYDG